MKRIGSLHDIAHLVRPDCQIVLHSGCASPTRLIEQFLEIAPRTGPVRIVDLTTIGAPAYLPGIETGLLRLLTVVPGRGSRRALKAGRVEIIRKPLSRVPAHVLSPDFACDILFLSLSPPDSAGRMTLGVSVDAMRACLMRDPVVVAEINPNMPATCGQTKVLAEDVDYIIDSDAPLVSVAPSPANAIDGAIADNIAGLIRNGDVLQTGIGTIPDLTALRLMHLRDLGLHSGIVTQAVGPLIEAGVINNSTKRHFAGVSVATMAAGDPSFYAFLDRNPEVQFMPCDWTHALPVLAAIPRLCAINGALEIDLSGRVNAETVDGRRVSAPGGQPDFANGAVAAPDGKSIVALRATSKAGDVSRIVPRLAPGYLATLAAGAVTHVVTEFGVAAIQGLTGSDLQYAIAGIAGPDHRSDLRKSDIG